MKRCSNCIIPAKARGILLDENGLCQLCRDYKTPIPRGEKELGKEIEKSLNDSSQYNCIVPVSGGRDSSYALFYVKNVLGLSPIAVNNDNDFTTDIARTNLDVITKNTKVPLIRVKSQNRISRKIVAEKFKMNSSFGAELVVAQTCEACKYGFESAAYNSARKYGIRLIIWGDSIDESTTTYHSLVGFKTPTKFKRLFSPGTLSLLRYKYYFNEMKRQYGSDSPKGLTELHLYDYVAWDRKLIVDTIQEKLGWSKTKESPTSWRIDCELIPLVDYLTEKAYGVSKMELGFSQMIRNGKMDREDALMQVQEIKSRTDLNALKVFLRTAMNIPDSCMHKVFGK